MSKLIVLGKGKVYFVSVIFFFYVISIVIIYFLRIIFLIIY